MQDLSRGESGKQMISNIRLCQVLNMSQQKKQDYHIQTALFLLQEPAPEQPIQNFLFVSVIKASLIAGAGAQVTIWAAVGVLRAWIERYGIPQALYTDWNNVYVRVPNAEERVTGAEPLTQFGRMCATLGIRIIPASSPQAKGRIERNHGTQQDRLVKKLRRKGIADIETANAFLETVYWADHNDRFAQAPASSDDFHVARPRGLRLDTVFRLEEERTVSNDWVVRYDSRLFQLERQSGQAPARSTVRVCEDAAGGIEIRYRDQVMRATEIVPGAAAAPVVSAPSPRVKAPVRNARRPSADHPWRRPDEREVPLWQAIDR